MKHDFKIGDVVTAYGWDGTYEVKDINEDQIALDAGAVGLHWFNATGKYIDFIKVKGAKMQVELGKKYRKVGTHEPVRVICVDRKDPLLPCLGLYTAGLYEGVLFFNHEGCDGDGGKIIEEIPQTDWSKVKMDTPIWVKFESWHKRHFHKFENERVHYWPNGTTSFTCDCNDDNNSELPEDCSLTEPKE